MARVQLLPQTDNLFTVFKDGWHQAEVAGDNATIEWQWTKKEATLAFKNPKKDAIFFLDVDSPGGEFHGPQQVQVVVNGQAVDEFTLGVGRALAAEESGCKARRWATARWPSSRFAWTRRGRPAQVPEARSKDPRELGVRVFHAFVDPR